ncbi:hypothetical protein ACH495_17185 [Micromonospora sp. NPDC018662]|uniref:hypothetical protein n=1 Tax=Micromonospora sp. NPDC018662 TaxID=3364238 RepID=UPI0037A7B153
MDGDSQLPSLEQMLLAPQADQVRPGGTCVVRSDGDLRWWTWAGLRGNVTLAARLADLPAAATVLTEPVRFVVGC